MNFGALKFPWGKNKEEAVNDEKKDVSEGEHEPHLKLVDLEEAKEPKKRTVNEVLEARKKVDELITERKQIKQGSQENRRKLEAKDFSFSAKNQEMVNAVFGEDIARLKEIKKELLDLSEEYGIDLEKIAHSPQESLALFEDKVRNSKLDVVQASADMSSTSSKSLAEIEQLKRQSDRLVERFWQLADLYKRYLDKVYPDEALISNMGATIKREGNTVRYDHKNYFTIQDNTLKMDEEMAQKGNPYINLQHVRAMPDEGPYNLAGEKDIKMRVKHYMVAGGEAVKDRFSQDEGLNAITFFSIVRKIAEHTRHIERRPSFKAYEAKCDTWIRQVIDGQNAERDIDEEYQAAVTKRSIVG